MGYGCLRSQERVIDQLCKVPVDVLNLLLKRSARGS